MFQSHQKITVVSFRKICPGLTECQLAPKIVIESYFALLFNWSQLGKNTRQSIKRPDFYTGPILLSNFLLGTRLMRSYLLSYEAQITESKVILFHSEKKQVTRKNTCYFKAHIQRDILHTPSLFKQDSNSRIRLYQNKSVQKQNRRTKGCGLGARDNYALLPLTMKEMHLFLAYPTVSHYESYPKSSHWNKQNLSCSELAMTTSAVPPLKQKEYLHTKQKK